LAFCGTSGSLGRLRGIDHIGKHVDLREGILGILTSPATNAMIEKNAVFTMKNEDV